MTAPVTSVTTVSRMAFPALLAAVLSFSVLQSLVVPALPDLQHDLHASPAATSWALSAFLLTSSTGTVLLSRLAELFGLRRLMLVSLGLLAAGTAVAALAPTISVLIAGRAVQGLGAASFPIAFALIRQLLPPERVPVAIGSVAAMFGIGCGIGLVVAGPIIAVAGWPGIFWASLALIALALIGVAAAIPVLPAAGTGRVDWTGTVLFTAGLTAVLVAVSEVRTWPTTAVIGTTAAGLVVLVLFGMVERRTADPLIDLAVLRRGRVFAADLAGLLIGFGLFGAFSLVPRFVETPTSAGFGFGASTTGAGLFLLPLAVTMLVAGPVAGRLSSRFGARSVLIAACIIAAAGFALLAVGLGEAWVIAAACGVLGIGVGFAFSSVINLIVESVPAADTAQATGVNTIVRTVGGALGAQVSTAILTTGAAAPTLTGYITAFAAAAIALLLAAAVVIFIGVPRTNTRAKVSLQR